MALLGSGLNESTDKHYRTASRVNSRVPIAVEWTDAGNDLRVEGVTLDVSSKGCLAVVPQGFTVGQHLRVVNLVTNQGCAAAVVWRGHEGRNGWELGLELQNPPADFWSLEF
ncbi:MAG: PilZ domain-containing protein [Acidobacteriia bacterium]|nr:PilZ domain-containing protein [Terriglobia bacterium]